MQKEELKAIAQKFTFKNLPQSEVEFSGDVPYEALASYRDAALLHMAEHVEMPGFRKGKVPPEMIVKKLGETSVLEEAVEMFVKDFYPELIETHNANAVGRPEIRITKLAPNNPVGLVVRAAIYPEVVLPKDWNKLAQKIALEAVLPATDEDVDKTLEQLRRNKVGSPTEASGSRKGPARPDDSGHSGEGEAVPELNDEFAKSLGAFENLAALKEQIKKGVTEEKERAAKDARRAKIIDALLEKTKVEVPKIFVESELEKIMGQMHDDVARFNVKFEEYLKQIGKTEDALREEFKGQAEKRAKLQLTLNKLAEEEKIDADAEAVEAEMKHAFEHFPDANPELVRIHIETVLKNEKVLKLLEGEDK
jgi:trigger factor